ncbi:MAG: hypothetical protein JRD05_08780 [Deltaproteobacteria bacterium]|nr:hypothetical protein [Deltaproteobacteria bacterium]
MNIEHRTSNVQHRMEKISGKELTRRVNHLCGGSVDLVDINNEKNLAVLDACLQHETQYGKRATMLQALKVRIRKLEKI